jgi:SAM-dependent methyltransferase
MGESDQSFAALGDHIVEQLTMHAGLCQDSRVLDIGCAYGRLPHALKRHGFAGGYLGIDVQKRHIRWCGRNLGGEGFEFRHVDLVNERYNPRGRSAIGDLDLGDRRFDVIAAFSVFTHMWPEDVAAYLRTIGRSLAIEGRAAATLFFLDQGWYDLSEAGGARLTMEFEREPGCRYESEDEPLHRVGYDARWLVMTAADYGLVPAVPPVFGRWSGRSTDPQRAPGYQDLLVFRRLDDALHHRLSPPPAEAG